MILSVFTSRGESVSYSLPSIIMERDSVSSAGIIVRGGTMINILNPLQIFNSLSVTGQRYRDKLLELCV